MMNKRYIFIFSFLTVLNVAGCATPEKVTLLPQPDGTSSAVIVQLKTGDSILLNQSYMAAKATEKKLVLEQTDEAAVNLHYKDVLDALPARAKSYTLPFNLDDSNLTPEAIKLVEIISHDIEKYPVPELIIIGHTDASGDTNSNDELSRQRAMTVLDFLKIKGIDITHASTVGRGSREPLVKTENGVRESKNRRVEIRLK